MMYARGESADEAAHSSFHAAWREGGGVRFRGWQRERVAWRGEAGARVVHVAPGDPPAHAAKAARVAEHVTQQLGLPPGWLLPTTGGDDVASSPSRLHALLLVSAAGRVDGACFAERLGAARRVQPATQPGGVIRAARRREAAAAGVRAVWVAPGARRRGAASALLDAARGALGAAGAPLPHHLLAFSQPTQAGRALAERYVGTQSFLVYDDADVGQHPDAPVGDDAQPSDDHDGTALHAAPL
jgi:N-acetyltransferase